MTPGTIIEIAGESVLLRSHDPILRSAIENRYSDFIIPAPRQTPVELTVDIDAAQFPAPGAPGRMKGNQVIAGWSDGKWRFERYDFRAEWNPQTRTGSICQSNPIISSTDSAVRMLHSILAVAAGGFLLHAASAIRNGHAFIFTGVSGAGKSTISGLMPQDVQLLTDEISYVRPDGQGFRAFGTPFMGNLGAPGKNVSAPLKALYLLAKGPENKIEAVSQKKATTALLRNVLFFAKDPELVGVVFETICRLVSSVPVYRLAFVPTSEVWELIA